jgi:hypothetical protein
MKKLRMGIGVLLALLLAGCTTAPKTFMRTHDEPGIWKTVEIREEMENDKIWEVLVDTLSQNMIWKSWNGMRAISALLGNIPIFPGNKSSTVTVLGLLLKSRGLRNGILSRLNASRIGWIAKGGFLGMTPACWKIFTETFRGNSAV